MFAELIGAGASLLGGLLNKSSSDKANAQQMALAQQNIALQREFAQNGIQWKAADAQKAGIHPLYAMGANTVSFNPVSVGITPDTSMGNAVSNAGQDISRAVASTSNSQQRAAQAQMTGLQLERAGLENELLRSQIARQRVAIGPPMPSMVDRSLIPGQGQTNNGASLVKTSPAENTTVVPGYPHIEPGLSPDVDYGRSETGYPIMPGKIVKERIEDSILQELAWSVRNNLPASFGWATPPKHIPLKPGRKWEYDVWKQEWQQRLQPLDFPNDRFSRGYSTGGRF